MISNISLSRRNFFKFKISFFVFVYSIPSIARSIESTKQALITDYYRGDWEDAFHRAFQNSTVVIIPENVECKNFNFNLKIPSDKKIIIKGTISGNGKGTIQISGNNQIEGINGKIIDVMIIISGGTPSLTGLELSGFTRTARVFIDGADGNIENLLIHNVVFRDANYGILRQGHSSTLTKGTITNCRFYNLQGDAIEWNVAINDEQLLIANHIIENINNTNKKPYWGIGIGLSGAHYDNLYPKNKTVKNFIIENIKGTNLRQLIHVENGSNFTIRNITAENILSEYSDNSGLEPSTIAIYGSEKFNIQNITMKNSNGIIIGFGVNYGKYISAPQNFTIKDVKINNTTQLNVGIKLALGNKKSSVSIENINIIGASMNILNKPENLTLKNISIKSMDLKESAITLNLDKRQDSRYKFNVIDNNLIAITNVQGISASGEKRVYTQKDLK
ncbi:hypothetical protein [Raoultella planticola]|uniref:hypothetical protein n=1 Tax=Raoultella planticola TaxID=575 RepID=UPI00067A9699|nr:hypothetical protein [Raoultella planticola]